MNLFLDFFDGNLNIERLNYGVVTLLLKVDNAKEMRNFRPICLLNVIYKIITEVLNNGLALFIHKMVSDCQYGFIKNRFILDSVVTLHEIIHEVKCKKQYGVIFKVDFLKGI